MSKDASISALNKLNHQQNSVSLDGNYQSSKSGLIIAGAGANASTKAGFYPQPQDQLEDNQPNVHVTHNLAEGGDDSMEDEGDETSFIEDSMIPPSEP